MAKLERELNYDFDELLHRIEQGIMNGSSTASLEDASDFMDSDARCSVRVFEIRLPQSHRLKPVGLR